MLRTLLGVGSTLLTSPTLFCVLVRVSTQEGLGPMSCVSLAGLPVLFLAVLYVIWRTSWLSSRTVSAHGLSASQFLALMPAQLLWRLPLAIAANSDSGIEISSLVAIQLTEYAFAPLVLPLLVSCESPAPRMFYFRLSAVIAVGGLMVSYSQDSLQFQMSFAIIATLARCVVAALSRRFLGVIPDVEPHAQALCPPAACAPIALLELEALSAGLLTAPTAFCLAFSVDDNGFQLPSSPIPVAGVFLLAVSFCCAPLQSFRTVDLDTPQASFGVLTGSTELAALCVLLLIENGLQSELNLHSAGAITLAGFAVCCYELLAHHHSWDVALQQVVNEASCLPEGDKHGMACLQPLVDHCAFHWVVYAAVHRGDVGAWKWAFTPNTLPTNCTTLFGSRPYKRWHARPRPAAHWLVPIEDDDSCSGSSSDSDVEPVDPPCALRPRPPSRTAWGLGELDSQKKDVEVSTWDKS